MGFDKASCEFLIHAKKHHGAVHGRVLTLGRQQLFLSMKAAKELARVKGIESTDENVQVEQGKGFAEPFLKLLGATSVESMDISDYEGATFTHDLNVPVPPEMHDKFDCIVDGGTIEHIFHFPNAIQSCMRMLRPGGHYIGITPVNNHMGHGFYQFSPELYYRVFSKVNGFEVRQMLMNSPTEWFEVSDPKVVKSRVSVVSSVPMMLSMVAQKVAPMITFTTPQQSDYVAAWQTVESMHRTEPREGENVIQHWMRKHLPTSVKTGFRKAMATGSNKKVNIDGLGVVNSTHFKRIEI